MVEKADTIAQLRSQLSNLDRTEKCDKNTRSKKPVNKKIRKNADSDDRFSSESDAFARIVSYMNAAERSERQIRERLERAGYEEDAMESAITRAVKCGLIDDTRYAEILIRSRISQGRGIIGIERELKDNGIEPSDIDGWPEEYCSSIPPEEERALAFLDAHPTHAKNIRESAYRKLVGKGFSSSAAAYAARIWSEMQKES